MPGDEGTPFDLVESCVYTIRGVISMFFKVVSGNARSPEDIPVTVAPRHSESKFVRNFG